MLRKAARKGLLGVPASSTFVITSEITDGRGGRAHLARQHHDCEVRRCAAFGLCPGYFLGRVCRSRGYEPWVALMLRRVDAGAELTYMPVQGAVRGFRPPKLPS